MPHQAEGIPLQPVWLGARMAAGDSEKAFPVRQSPRTAVLIDVVCKSSGHQEKKTLYNAVATA